MQSVACAHLGFKNVATNVPRIFVNEAIYRYGLSQNGPRWILPSKQESILLMEDAENRFCKLGEQVLHAFSGRAFYSDDAPVAVQE